jgi:hypothetical protein
VWNWRREATRAPRRLAKSHAQYTFDCQAPASLTAIEFDYFRAFAGAQRLDVTVITPKGQTKFEASRRKPRIDLTGMM